MGEHTPKANKPAPRGLPGDLHRDHLRTEGSLRGQAERQAKGSEVDEAPDRRLREGLCHDCHALSGPTLLPVWCLGEVSGAIDVVVEVDVAHASENAPLSEGVEATDGPWAFLETSYGGSLQEDEVEGDTQCLSVQGSPCSQVFRPRPVTRLAGIEEVVDVALRVHKPKRGIVKIPLWKIHFIDES